MRRTLRMDSTRESLEPVSRLPPREPVSAAFFLDPVALTGVLPPLDGDVA